MGERGRQMGEREDKGGREEREREGGGREAQRWESMCIIINKATKYKLKNNTRKLHYTKTSTKF